MTRKNAAIIGVGETDWSRDSGRSTLTLATQAATAALDDAGVAASSVDGILCFTEGDSSPTQDVAARLGIEARFSCDLFGGGGNPEAMVAIASQLVRDGVCRYVLCYRAMNGRSGARMSAAVSSTPFPNAEWLVPVGATNPAALFGFAAQRYLHTYAVDATAFAGVSLQFRDHAQRNPSAMMFEKPLTRSEYLNSEWIVEPFRKLDCCLETDGAAAILVSTEEYAAEARRGGVKVVAVEGKTTKRRADYFQAEELIDVPGRLVADRLYASSGYGPDDIEVAAMYDCFTYTVLAQLEAYSFCGPGEAPDFVAEGNLSLSGRLPANTAGGQLSEAYTHGLNNLIELIRQVRGDYVGTDRQAHRRDVGLCAGWTNPGVASGLIIERL